MLETSADLTAAGASWVSSIIGLLTVALGGGGLAALLKVRHDKQTGVAQLEASENEATSNRLTRIIEMQTQALLEPFERELENLRGRLSALEKELDERRRKYWTAVAHIRALRAWITERIPGSVTVPDPPPTLADDL